MSNFDATLRYYLHIARQSVKILRCSDLESLLLAIDYHFRKLRRERSWEYSYAQDYISGLVTVAIESLLAITSYFREIKQERLQDHSYAQDYTPGLVTIAILNNNRLDLIKPCVEAIQKYHSMKYKIELLIGDTGTTELEVHKYYRFASHHYKNINIIRFNYYDLAKNYNLLIRDHARGQYIILLNHDLIVTPNWLDNLVDPLGDTRIGIVGAKLLYRDNTIQHAGVEYDERGYPFHIYSRQPRDFPEANYPAMVPGVTLAAVALRHDVFDRFQLGEGIKEPAQDADFCLRLGEAGFQVLYNPATEINLSESASRNLQQEVFAGLWLRRKWAAKIAGILTQGKQRLRFDEHEYHDAITIMRDDGIGDLLMGVCAFKKLRERYPEKRLILATYQRNISMMVGFKIFDEFIPIPDGRKHYPIPIPRAAKIFNFIGLEKEFGKIWGLAKDDNKVHRHLLYTRKLGLDQDFESVPIPEYHAAAEKIQQLLHEMGVTVSQRFVTINLIGTNPARSWWEPYYPCLLDAIQAMGFVPVVVGTTNSKCFNGQGIINLVGKTKNIPEYIEAVKLGAYVISTDSSAYHIAAMAGIPFLAIITGGVKPEARLNYYKDFEVVEPPASLPCYPCWDMGCTDLSVRWKTDPCRIMITPEEVIEKFKRLVARFPLP
jgi:ADP-heptose:LPS heptosyltransferase/GT2 family glycosyltransferase